MKIILAVRERGNAGVANEKEFPVGKEVLGEISPSEWSPEFHLYARG